MKKNITHTKIFLTLRTARKPIVQKGILCTIFFLCSFYFASNSSAMVFSSSGSQGSGGIASRAKFTDTTFNPAAAASIVGSDKIHTAFGISVFIQDTDDLMATGIAYADILNLRNAWEFFDEQNGTIALKILDVEEPIFVDVNAQMLAGKSIGSAAFVISFENTTQLGINFNSFKDDDFTTLFLSTFHPVGRDWYEQIAVAAIKEMYPDALLTDGYLSDAVLANLKSHTKMTGLSVNELGFTFAKEILGINVGVTPKVQHVMVFAQRIAAHNMNDLSIAPGQQHLGVNIDIGLQKSFIDRIHFGLVASNLIPKSYQLFSDMPELGSATISPQLNLSMGINLFSWLLVHSSFDFLDNWDLGQNMGRSQYLRLGMELGNEDKFGVFRLGHVWDVNKVRPEITTLGFGFLTDSEQAGIDLTGMYSEGGLGLAISMSIKL